MEQPNYVVVFCKHFGQGTPGWRLSEVDYYCFANRYYDASKIKDAWQEYSYGTGLAFIVKYKNWINKDGPKYDGSKFLEKKYFR